VHARKLCKFKEANAELVIEELSFLLAISPPMQMLILGQFWAVFAASKAHKMVSKITSKDG